MFRFEISPTQTEIKVEGKKRIQSRAVLIYQSSAQIVRESAVRNNDQQFDFTTSVFSIDAMQDLLSPDTVQIRWDQVKGTQYT